MPKLNDALGMKVGSQPVKRVYKGSTVVLNGIENLALNPRFEGTGTATEIRRNLATRPTAVNGGWLSNNGATHVISLDATVNRRAGVSSRKCYYNGTAGVNVSVLSLYSVGSLTNASVDRLPVTAATAYTMSVYVRASYANTRYQMSASFYDAGGVSLGSISTGILTTTLAANTWGQLVQSNIVAPANSTTCFLNLALYTPSSQANGAQLTDFGWATDVLFEKSPAVMPYFDGGYNTDTDLVASWTGTANASASVLKGSYVAGFTSGNTPISSTQWSRSGTTSMRIISTYPTAGSGYVEVATNTNPKGLLYGKTYTMSVVCRQIATSPAQKNITLLVGSGTVSSVTTIPNAAGEYDVNMTFTIPASGNWYLRMYNGGAMGTVDVWFDNLMIVEGTQAKPYKDGSNAGWVWSGTANNSSSYGLG